MSTNNAFAPGWHRDPDDPNQFRWFDGTRFTDQTRAAGPGLQVTGPTAAAHHADDSAWERYPERMDRSYPQYDHGKIWRDDERARKRAQRLHYGAIAAGLLIFASGGSALIVIVPMAIMIAVVMLLFARGSDRKKVRAALGRWAQGLGFVDEGGTVIPGDGSALLGPEEADATLRALRAGGFRIRVSTGARLRGTPWRAGEGTTVQTIIGYREYRRDPAVITVVTVPLLPDAAANYVGLAVERPRKGRRFQLRAWEPFEGTPDGLQEQLNVTAHPAQRVDVGFHPIVQMGDEWTWGLQGWVVADGQLSVWGYGDWLGGIANDQLREEACKPFKGEAGDGMRLARLIDQARHLQYLLYDPAGTPSGETIDYRDVRPA